MIGYYFRFGWDERLQIIHVRVKPYWLANSTELSISLQQGPPHLGCGKENCDRIWNPDDEEQRFCYQCRKWYHTSCLTISRKNSQDAVIKKISAKLDLTLVPQILQWTAFQPAARGGPRLFTAGNIRMVTKARELVESEEKRANFSGGLLAPNDDEWTRFLESYFGVLETDRGNIEKEQLVASGQDIYLCPVCKEFV